MCFVEKKDKSKEQEVEQQQIEQQQQQEKQQQEEDKHTSVERLDDQEDEEVIVFEGENIEMERDEEIECMGITTSESRGCYKKSRTKAKMIKTLLSGGNFEDQCGILKSFLMDSQLKEHAKKLNIFNARDTFKIETFDNIASIMSHSSPNKKGNLNVHKKCFRIVWLHQLLIHLLWKIHLLKLNAH